MLNIALRKRRVRFESDMRLSAEVYCVNEEKLV